MATPFGRHVQEEAVPTFAEAASRNKAPASMAKLATVSTLKWFHKQPGQTSAPALLGAQAIDLRAYNTAGSGIKLNRWQRKILLP